MLIRFLVDETEVIVIKQKLEDHLDDGLVRLLMAEYMFLKRSKKVRHDTQ